MFALLRLRKSEVQHCSHGAEVLSQQDWLLLQAESVPLLFLALGGLVYPQLIEPPNLGFHDLLFSELCRCLHLRRTHEILRSNLTK